MKSLTKFLTEAGLELTDQMQSWFEDLLSQADAQSKEDFEHIVNWVFPVLSDDNFYKVTDKADSFIKEVVGDVLTTNVDRAEIIIFNKEKNIVIDIEHNLMTVNDNGKRSSKSDPFDNKMNGNISKYKKVSELVKTIFDGMDNNKYNDLIKSPNTYIIGTYSD